MFSVRGDGLTTATTDKPNVSAVLAQASSASYTDVVLHSQTTTALTLANFYLYKVICT